MPREVSNLVGQSVNQSVCNHQTFGPDTPNGDTVVVVSQLCYTVEPVPLILVLFSMFHYLHYINSPFTSFNQEHVPVRGGDMFMSIVTGPPNATKFTNTCMSDIYCLFV